MYLSLERFEEELAVLCDDSGKTVVVDRAVVPVQAEAGDILYLENGIYRLDEDETAKRRNRIWQMEQLLRNKQQN
ncbi:MAG: DUF3006 domain-containing protein [Clostridia bacterium]|nr:DUF3006 domain-containing protein [Clostridia bacterium]